MAKKPSEEIIASIEKQEEKQIESLPTDMGREDLNKIAQKVNEVIARLNG